MNCKTMPPWNDAEKAEPFESEEVRQAVRKTASVERPQVKIARLQISILNSHKCYPRRRLAKHPNLTHNERQQERAFTIL